MSGSSFLPTNVGVGKTGVAVASAALGATPSGGGTCLVVVDAVRGNGAGTVAVGLAPALLGHGGSGVLLQAASKAAEIAVTVSACHRRPLLGSGLLDIDCVPKAWRGAERKVMVWVCKDRKGRHATCGCYPLISAGDAGVWLGCCMCQHGIARSLWAIWGRGAVIWSLRCDCARHPWRVGWDVGHSNPGRATRV